MTEALNMTKAVSGQDMSSENIYRNLTREALIEHVIINKEGELDRSGALVCHTGKFTGRSPKDRFIVAGATSRDAIWWGAVNREMSAAHFDGLRSQMLTFLSMNRKVYVRDAFVGADPVYRQSVRLCTTLAWHSLFASNLFITPDERELAGFVPDYTIVCIPEFESDPEKDGTRSRNFTIVNLHERVILIGGTGYAGEIKKSMFSVLNYLLPTAYGVLPMHCAANVGRRGDVALFFGLSGTGKTTLSADPARKLIGDDEHGWSERGVFNFEGGCYAKVVGLDAESEPQIWNAIKFGAVLENTLFHAGTRETDFDDQFITENTRVSYPIQHIAGAQVPSVGDSPRHIFFLTADAFGVLPPLARLTREQAMYYFLSGYTAKVAGTEVGVKEPQVTFSACFGEAFMPLHPVAYTTLLGEKILRHDVKVWLINTGWTGGPYGEGHRISLNYTRSMIKAVLEDELSDVAYKQMPVFGLMMPCSCPGVPDDVLDPVNTWADKVRYARQAKELAAKFKHNMHKYGTQVNDEIKSGGVNL